MESELIEAKAREYAHTYILLVLIAVQKRLNPDFGGLVADSFDEYIGRHEPDVANEYKKELLSAARLQLRGLLESESITVR